MDLRAKLTILADAAKYDASCSSSGSKRAGEPGGLGNTNGMGICHSYTPDGRCVSLLKVLLTNYCIYDCQYCINRISSDTPRARFAVEEVVNLTLDFYRRNYIEGLFLSSGVIKSPDATMEQLAEVARTLREVHRFGGYIHIKAVPGASPDLIDAAARYADRMSANIELPTAADLQRLAPEKSVDTIEATMGRMQTKKEEADAEAGPSSANTANTKGAPSILPAGQTTQMIIGATPSPDSAILETAERLYKTYKLRRVYYSAFSPIPSGDPRLPFQAPPLLREHRLYQADWLLRFYGFEASELVTADAPNLDAEIDPKLAWALRRRDLFPVDVNTAPRELLLRIPGVGKKSVLRILSTRRHRRLRMLDLARIGVLLKSASPFVIAADHNPEALRLDRRDLRDRIAPRGQQLDLFAARAGAVGGEI
jgi:putative DNA modification/repair radical SAM protein